MHNEVSVYNVVYAYNQPLRLSSQNRLNDRFGSFNQQELALIPRNGMEHQSRNHLTLWESVVIRFDVMVYSQTQPGTL